MGLAAQTKAQGRTTLLDAVNVCLENIGEQPVDNLDNEQIQDARIAERDERIAEEQARVAELERLLAKSRREHNQMQARALKAEMRNPG